MKLTVSRLVKPFESNTQRTKTITDSPEIDGFEGAGMGKIVHLKQKVSVLDIVKQVKEHLNIEHGKYALSSGLLRAQEGDLLNFASQYN